MTIQNINSSLIGWALMENGYVHTDGLTEVDANEMLERYTRIFPENEYCLFYIR